MDEVIDTKPEKQDEIRDKETGRFIPGVSGNPEGRPKGKTLKEYAKEWYMMKTDEEKRDYLEKLEAKIPGFAWRMAEGNPSQDVGLPPNSILPFIINIQKLDEQRTLPEGEERQAI